MILAILRSREHLHVHDLAKLFQKDNKGLLIYAPLVPHVSKKEHWAADPELRGGGLFSGHCSLSLSLCNPLTGFLYV
jgi:hypothetical protein